MKRPKGDRRRAEGERAAADAWRANEHKRPREEAPRRAREDERGDRRAPEARRDARGPREREDARPHGVRHEPPRAPAAHSSNAAVHSPEAGFQTSEARTQVYGLLPVLEALRAGNRPLERIALAEGAHEHRLRELFELARAANVPVRRAPRAELTRMSAGANHQGVVAIIAAARYAATEELLDALSARVGTDDPPLAVVLDGVEDPRNLGAIIRTAECSGAHGVFVPERRAAGLTEVAAKVAAGALEYVPVARASNVVRLVEELKGRGVWTIGAAAEGALDYTDWDWTQPCALLLGGEGEGLRRLVRERCDALVRVPLRGRITSLNVSVAAGVLLYEAVRQRTAARLRAYKQNDERGTMNDEL